MHQYSVIIVGLLFTVSTYADDLHSEKIISPQTKDGWSLSVETYKESYKEKLNQKPLMREDAKMVGITAINQHRLTDAAFMRSTMRFAFGESNYTGALQNQQYGSLRSNGQSRTALDLRLTGHYTTPTTALWTPYGGIGYRLLVDNLQESGSGGYKRESNYIYAIAGLSATLVVADQVQLDPYFQYNHLIIGRQNSYLWGEGYAPLTHNQHKGYGIELGVPISFISKNSWQMTPFVRYWHIADSKPVTFEKQQTTTLEPDNKTKEFGIKIDYKF